MVGDNGLTPAEQAEDDRIREQNERNRERDRAPLYCKHGRYIGGMGADYMCQRCEDGD